MRTKGATSCIAIKLSKLNKHLTRDSVIFVSRQQMRAMGLDGDGVKMTDKGPVIKPPNYKYMEKAIKNNLKKLKLEAKMLKAMDSI